MTTVDIHISTNITEKEGKNLYIPEEAIRKFTGEGFQSNLYQGRILFESMPRGVYPDIMHVIINIKDVAEGLIALGTIVNALIKLLKNTKGYQQEVEIYYKKGEKEFSCDIYLDAGSDEKEVLEEIKNIIKDSED